MAETPTDSAAEAAFADGGPDRIAVTYYASLAEAVGTRTEELPVARRDVGAVRAAVAARHGGRAAEIAALSCVLDGDRLLREPGDPVGTRVDLLPPFAGG